GNTTPPFDSNVAVAGPDFWTGLDEPAERPQDVAIAMWRPDAVYVVMLVEQDGGKDVSGNEALSIFKTACLTAWSESMQNIAATGGSPTESQLDMAAANVGNAFLAA